MDKIITIEQIGRFRVVHNIPQRTEEEEERKLQEIAQKIYNMISNSSEAN